MLNMNSWIDVEGKTKDLFEKYNLPFNEEKLIAGIEHETARMNLALNNLAKLYGQPAFDNAFENFIEEFAHFEAEGVSVEESRKTILRYVEELAKSANSSDKFGKRKQEFEKYKIACKSDVAPRPYRRFGQGRFKRSHVTIKLIPINKKE